MSSYVAVHSYLILFFIVLYTNLHPIIPPLSGNSRDNKTLYLDLSDINTTLPGQQISVLNNIINIVNITSHTSTSDVLVKYMYVAS